MSEAKCPYCNTEQEINHDDGYGYDEDVEHEQECCSCDKTFIFTTALSFDYEVFCQPGDHDFEDRGSRWPYLWCSKCEATEKKSTKDN